MAVAGFSAERALVAALDALDEGTVVFDEEYRCRAAGYRAAELLGVPAQSLVGLRRADVVGHFAEACVESAAVLAALGDEALADGSTAIDPIEIAPPHARFIVWTSVPVMEGGRRIGRVDVLRDVTRERGAELKSEELSKRLEEVSTVDEPTGLVNKKAFERDADREHRRSQRAWIPYAVILLRVDGLERAPEGSAEVLRRLADELRSARREYDVVARWGETEFAMLLPGADAAATSVIVQRCAHGTTTCLATAGEGVVATIGAAVWIPPSGDGAIDMMRRAGDALAAAFARHPGSIEIDAVFGKWKDPMP